MHAPDHQHAQPGVVGRLARGGYVPLGYYKDPQKTADLLIEVDGEAAVSEAYVTVALWTLPDETGQQKEMVGRGRYLDQWSCRDGVWAIDHREHVLDMFTVQDLCKGAISAKSTRDTSDPSFGFIKKF